MMAKHRADMRATGSGFNGLQFQVTQLARELPALAYGPQMFIAAISNNFPMLQDEIKKTKLEMLKLKNEGKETVPIWKQMAKAIFSWQTAIIILITAYMMFSKEINKAIASVFSYNKGINIAKETQKSLNKALDEGTKSAGDEIAKLKTLYTISQDETRTREDRLGAVNELQEIYPDYLKNIDDEAFLVGGAYQQYQLLTRAILDNAIAKAKLNEITEIGASIYEEEKKYFKLIDELSKKEKALASEEVFAGSQEADELLEMEIKSLRKKRDKSLAIIGDYAEQANNIMSTIKSADLIEDDKKQKEKSQKDKKGTEPYDNRLRMLQLANEEQIIKMQMKQKDDWLRYVEEVNAKEELLASEKADLIKEYEVDQNIQLIEARRALNVGVIDLIKQKSKEKIAAAKGDKIEIANIEKQTAEEVKEILNQQLEYEKSVRDAANAEQVANADRDAAISAEKAKILSDQTVAMYWNMADEAYMASQETVLAQIKSKKLSNRQIEKLQRELAENQIEQDMLALESMIANEDLTDEEREKRMDELVQLRKRYNDLLIQNSKKGNDDDIDNIKDWARSVADIYTELFNIINSLYERQLQAAENVYDNEQKYAGTSVEQRLESERKYEKKQAEIRKKQSVAQKMQSAFNVVMQNLEAWPKAIAGDPLAIAQLFAAGVSLAAIAAEPIPAYKSGGDHKEGIARVSEEGQELFIDKKGRAFLTPKEETIAHFPSGEFIPHDETQRMLANFAMRNDREIIDMSNTNRYLRNIDKNTRNQQTIDFIGGYKIIKRNGITSKIRI